MSKPNIFVDFVSSVSHANGVFRIILSQQVQDKESEEVGCLLIPAGQLQPILRAMADGANEIRDKLQAKRDETAAKDNE